MKSLQIGFAGLVTLFLLGGCAQAIGQPTNTPQDTNTVAPTVTFTAGPTVTPTLSVTPLPPPTRRPTAGASPSLTPATTVPPLASFTPMLTYTITRTPTITSTPTITYTPTIFRRPIIGFAPWTKTPTSLACSVQYYYPHNPYITVTPRTDIVVHWQFINIGSAPWSVDDFEFGFAGGDKTFSRGNGDDYSILSFTVYKNDKINIQRRLKAPKELGTYVSIWGIRKTNKTDFFCTTSFTITVVAK